MSKNKIDIMKIASKFRVAKRKSKLRWTVSIFLTYILTLVVLKQAKRLLFSEVAPESLHNKIDEDNRWMTVLEPQSFQDRIPQRNLLETSQNKTKISSSEGKAGRKRNCTPPAIEQFPRPIMSQSARRSGGLIVHLLITIYLFIAIALVCDDYFVPSLEMICDRLELSEDVGGATFMAAGSSAPELATSLIAVFVAKDDIGISGVIGSAVFNILFVISICALFAGHVVEINWWPLIRDCFCYCIAIAGLLMTIADEEVTWYESLFLLILYGAYIVLMIFNKTVEGYTEKLNIPFRKATKDEKSSLFGVKPTVGANGSASEKVKSNLADDHAADRLNVEGMDGEIPVSDNVEVEATQPKSMVSEKKGEAENMWEVPVGLWARVVWGVTLPLVAAHYISIPDTRKVRWRHWYLGSFIMSMLWIAFYSYFMVWMITIIGFTLGIPDTVMGLTLIAVGVSVPDALSSLCVVKQGFGDMAISNAIGSNVFDILICLGLPWFLKTAIVDPGARVPVESKGLTYSTLSLFSTVVFLIVVTHYNGWKLDVKYGIVLLVWYLIFMLFASLYELNVFGEFNPPECGSLY